MNANQNKPNNSFFIDDNNYFYGWLKNQENGYAGLYWETKSSEDGEELYPKNRTDRFLRSSKFGGIIGSPAVDKASREYVRWTVTEDIGFINPEGTWQFRTDKEGNAYVPQTLTSKKIISDEIVTNGSLITNINADNITTGTLSKNRLPAIIDSDTTGNAASTDKLNAPITLSFSSDAEGSLTTDFSKNEDIKITVKDDSHSHDLKYYNKIISDARFLNITAKAVDSDLLDGYDSSYFATNDDLLIQKSRIDNILEASDADADSFKEIVDIINNIDLENDDNLINFSKEINTKIENINSNIITNKMDADQKINTEKNRAIQEEEKLNTNLNLEIKRAIDSEESLNLKIDNKIIAESARAIAKENELNEAISNEILRATEEESSINDKITEINKNLKDSNDSLTGNILIEKTRAQAAEDELNNKLTQEITRAETIEKDLYSKIEDEKNRAIESERDWETYVLNEMDRAKKEESRIKKDLNNKIDIEKGRIDSILLASDVDADSFKEIVDIINSVDLDNDNNFANYARKTDENISNLDNKINGEITRALSQEDELNTNISSETGRAKLRENEIEKKIDDEIKTRNDQLLITNHNLELEIQRAQKIESDLNLKIDDEIIRAQDKEKVLDNRITNEADILKNNISELESKTVKALTAEANRAKAYENVLDNKITDESIRAKKAEADLNKTIEDNLLITQEKLSKDLTDEITRATLKENYLDNSKVSKSGDTLTGNLTFEKLTTGISWSGKTSIDFISDEENNKTYFKWVNNSDEKMTLKDGVLDVKDNITINGRPIALKADVPSKAANAALLDGVSLDKFIRNDIATDQNIKSNLNIEQTLRAANIIETSSIKYKKGVQEIKNASDILDHMTGVKYKWKKDDTNDIGFIAEEIYEILPELVYKNKEGEIEGMNYSKITAVLVNGFKEQQKEIQELKRIVKLFISKNSSITEN